MAHSHALEHHDNHTPHCAVLCCWQQCAGSTRVPSEQQLLFGPQLTHSWLQQLKKQAPEPNHTPAAGLGAPTHTHIRRASTRLQSCFSPAACPALGSPRVEVASSAGSNSSMTCSSTRNVAVISTSSSTAAAPPHSSHHSSNNSSTCTI